MSHEEKVDSSREGGVAESGLARSGIIVSAMTFISRITGLVREIVFAAIFGDSPAADTFFVAFKIPNFLRRLFAEGAFSQAFVPVLSEYRQTRSREAVKHFIDHVAGCLGIILVIITVLGVLGAPLISTLFAPGYLDNEATFARLVSLLRITFPYILLISLTGFAGSVLQSYGRFAIPAITPVWLNISLIGCALVLSPLLEEPIMALAWGVLLAGLIQLMFQLPFLYHLRMLPRPRLDTKDEGVRKVISLMIPIMFSVSVGQINLMLDTILATTQASGSVSWLYYADRLLELPLGIFGIAIATVILPSLSRIHASRSPQEFSDTLDWGLRCIVLVGVPASLALITLAEPLIITLYQRGAFSADAVAPTVDSLRAYALGLLGFMAVKVLVNAYFSRQDTRTPVRIAVKAMVANMGLNLVFIVPLAHVGLALATSIAAFINAGLLLRGLLSGGHYRIGGHWLGYGLRLAGAAGVMTVVLWLVLPATQTWLDWGAWDRIWHLAGLCCLGGVLYTVCLLVSGLRPAHFKH